MPHEIFLIGVNHRTAEVEIREKFALNKQEIFLLSKKLEQQINLKNIFLEHMALSTCNRVEIFLSTSADANFLQDGCSLLDTTIKLWAEIKDCQPTCLSSHVYIYKNWDAVRHIFNVASGLDSMILGEPQILGQLKEAYKTAVKFRSTRVILNRLLHKTFSVAKKIRAGTSIGESAVSISYAAVALAKRIFGDMSEQKAMLVGAGEMAELTALHLMRAGVKDILVVNRTLSRAEKIARRFKGRPLHISQLFENLPFADIVITSTGSSKTIIQAPEVSEVLRKRKQKPIFFIDIAVPRDIDAEVNKLDNVFLYDIDDLKEVIEENLALRKNEAQKAAIIIEEEVDNFQNWLASLALKPTIIDILNKNEKIAFQEVQKTLRHLDKDISEKIRPELEKLALSISHKICHDPLTFLKLRGLDKLYGGKYIDLTRKIFNLDHDNYPVHKHDPEIKMTLKNLSPDISTGITNRNTYKKHSEKK